MKRKIKVIISVLESLLVVLMIIPITALNTGVFAVSTWSGSADTEFSGSGTSKSPYLITTADELAGLAKNVNSGTTYEGLYLSLTQDVNLNSIAGGGSGIVRNCLSTANVTGTSKAVGIVGAADDGTGSAQVSIIISNCLATGTVRGTFSIGAIIGEYDSTSGLLLTNYYLVACARDTAYTTQFGVGAPAASSSTADIHGQTTGAYTSNLTRGEITYYLNGSRNEGTLENPLSWFQTIGKHNIPQLSGDTVYYGYHCSCENATFSNHILHSTNDETGNYDSNGFCTVCGGGMAMAKLNDTSYNIANAGQLFYLKKNAVSNNYAGYTFLLTNDIKIPEGRIWSSMSNVRYPFRATLDGQGYEISGLTYENTSRTTIFLALFYCIGSTSESEPGGVVKNLGLNIDYSSNVNYVAGICNTLNNYGVIENCYVSGSISGYNYLGGICSDNKGTIKSSHTTVTIYGNSKVGAVCGVNTGVISDCYYVSGSTTGGRSNGNIVEQFGVGNISISSFTDDVEGATIPTTMSKVNSGELATLLQNAQTPDGEGKIPQVWGQKVTSTGGYPIISTEEKNAVMEIKNRQNEVIGYPTNFVGDMNGDKAVTIEDYTAIKSLIFKSTYTAEEIAAGDLNGDTVIDAFDIMLLE